MATTTIQLAGLHVLEFLTYHRCAEHRKAVEAWLGGLGPKDGANRWFGFPVPRGGEGLAQVDLTEDDDPLDVMMVLFQVEWKGAADLEECLARIRAARDFRVVEEEGDQPHPPPPSSLGRTTVLLAEAEGDHEELKRALWEAIEPKGESPLVGGAIADGVDLYFDQEDAAWVVLLARPDVEGEAARTAYESLRHYLTFVHKVRAQQARYDKHRSSLKSTPEGLKRETEGMDAQVRKLAAAPDPDRSKLLKAALAQRLSLLKEDRPFRRDLGVAKAMRTTLVANRHNLRDLLKIVGTGPGVEALGEEIERANREIATIEADLAYARIAVEAVDRLLRDHTDIILTAQSLAEARANELRERDEKYRDRRNLWIALLAAWLGLTQIWAAAVGVAYAAGSFDVFRLRTASAWMLAPAIVFGLPVLRWIRPHSDQGARRPEQ